MRKLIPIFIILILLAAGFFAYRAYARQQQAQVMSSLQTVAAERGELVSTVGATGTVRANQTTILSWQTTGIVDQVQAKVGDRVEAGQELAYLKQTSLQQNIILAQADLVNSQKALDDLQQSQLASAQALQALQNAQDGLAELDEQTALKRAEAWDQLLQAQQVYSDTLERRQNLDFAADSQLVRDARQTYEDLLYQFNRERKIFADIPGDPKTNPEKARAQFNLKLTKFKLDQAQKVLDLYGGEPTNQQYNQADADLDLAQARLAEAELAWERIKDGADPAQKALLDAQLADSQRTYDRLKDGPDPNDIAAAEARVAAARASIDMARLVAPFSGTLTEINIKPGDQVSPGNVAIRIDDLSHLLVDVQVSEVDINRIQVSQPVDLSFDAILNQEYQGSVAEVARVGNVNQGVVEFTVTVELTDADEAVRPGMTSAVNVVIDQLQDVLLVPNRAVRVVDGQRVLYVLRNGVLSSEPVTLGASSDTMSELVEGNIQAGDPIVLNPPQTFESNGPPPFMRR